MVFLYLNIKININDCQIGKDLQSSTILFSKIINFFLKKVENLTIN